MNYYLRHIGDYARDTAHLSLIEHGAYAVLLDRYYATERGIPADQAHRLARARTPDEIAAVDTVLSEFFTLVDGVWRNKRADGEIASAHVRIDAARKNGRNGGRPKSSPVPSDSEQRESPAGLDKELTGNPAETQQKPSGLPAGLQNVTQQEPKANPEESSPCSNLQSPVSSNQKNSKEETRSKNIVSHKAADDPAFEAFWSAFPRKTAKEAARKAWRKHGGEKVLPTIFADIDARIASRAWQLDRKQFIPHPATYLTGERWSDEIIPPPPNGGKPHETSGYADRPRCPADRLRAIVAAREAQRKADDSIVGGDAPDLRPSVRGEFWDYAE